MCAIGPKGKARKHGPHAPSVPKAKLGYLDHVRHQSQRQKRKLLNRTSVNMIKMFNIREAGRDSQKDRINKAGITKDAVPPPVSFM